MNKKETKKRQPKPLPLRATDNRAVPLAESDKALLVIGHNSTASFTRIQKDVAQIESLDEQIRALRSQQKQIKALLKQQGIPTGPLNNILRLRRLEDDVRQQYIEDNVIIAEMLEMPLFRAHLTVDEQESVVMNAAEKAAHAETVVDRVRGSDSAA